MPPSTFNPSPLPPTTPRSTETPHDIASDIIRLLRASSSTLGVAESLTGGLLMATLVSVPGASAAFRGGVVSYATPLKQRLLGVDEGLIQREGVIHGDVARQMAEGARHATAVPPGEGEGEEETGLEAATWGIGTTGVAGPDMQDGKPVGTVYIGVAGPFGGDGSISSKAFGPFSFPGARERVREATVAEALARLREVLVEREKETGRGDGV